MVELSLHLLHAGLLLILILGAAFGYGVLALSWMRLPYLSRGEVGVFGLGLGLGAISLLMLSLSALHLIYPAAAWALLVVGVALALTYGRRLLCLAPAPALGDRSTPLERRAVRLGLALVIGLALIYALIANALMPPTEYDVVAYHFAIPKLYMQAHGLIYIPFIPYSNWPLGTEMLFMIGLLLHSEELAQLITWSFTLLLCAALVTFGNRWLPARAGWVAAAALCSTPMVTRLTGTGLIEMPLTCYTFLAFYALWHWRESGSLGWLMLSALLAGYAAATKLNGAAAAIVFAGLALAIVARRGRLSHTMRLFLIYGLASLLVVLPWYVKTWIYTGNPIWPFFYTVLGGRDWDALGETYLLGYIRTTNMLPTLANWATGLWQATIDKGRFGSFLLGPYTLALLPLGLLPAVARPALRPLMVSLSVATLALYTIWFLLTHQTRFMMPFIPMSLLIGAAGVGWLWERGSRPLRIALQVALVAWLLAGSWLFDADYQRRWQLGLGYASGLIDRPAALSSAYPDYSAFSYINQQLPLDAYVVMAPYEARGYYLDRRYLWVNPIGQRYLRLEQIPDAAALRAELRRQGVTHVLMNTRYIFDTILYWEHINSLFNDLVSSHARLLYERDLSRVYVLDYADTGAASQMGAP